MPLYYIDTLYCGFLASITHQTLLLSPYQSSTGNYVGRKGRVYNIQQHAQSVWWELHGKNDELLGT